ncbi:hypothetical protein LOD59_11095, partial [Xylella fastidiosa subsp. multiplex]|nr:hypothetical protein [Xylella fastidiosa subsp. multiplex]
MGDWGNLLIPYRCRFPISLYTGRWAGRLFQPHNLPRPTLSQPVIAVGIDAMKAGCVDLVFDDVMALTSSALRSCLI